MTVIVVKKDTDRLECLKKKLFNSRDCVWDIEFKEYDIKNRLKEMSEIERLGPLLKVVDIPKLILMLIQEFGDIPMSMCGMMIKRELEDYNNYCNELESLSTKKNELRQEIQRIIDKIAELEEIKRASED